MKCNQSRPGFELVSPCPFPTTITITPRAPPLANHLWCIDFLTPPTPPIILQRIPAFLESLMLLKNWRSIHVRGSKSSLKHSIRVKHNFIAYRSSKMSDWIFEIHQLWQSGFSRVYSNSYYSCSFEPEIVTIGQSFHKMYSNYILNFQESTTILNAHTKKVWKLIEYTTYHCLCVPPFSHRSSEEGGCKVRRDSRDQNEF